MNVPLLHEVALARQSELLAEAERRHQARQARPPGKVSLPAFLALRPGPGWPRFFRPVPPCPEGQPC